MKVLPFFLLILGTYYPLFADGHKVYKKEKFEEIKNMKIEHLNKKIKCVKGSNNFKEMKKCWAKKKLYWLLTYLLKKKTC